MVQVVPGIVTNITSAGLFVAVTPTTQGLVPYAEIVSAADGSSEQPSPNHPPSHTVSQELKVRVISLRNKQDRMRVTLSTSLRRINPSIDTSEQLAIGSCVKARVVSLCSHRASLSLELPGPPAELLLSSLSGAAEGGSAPDDDLRHSLRVGDLLEARVVGLPAGPSQRVHVTVDWPPVLATLGEGAGAAEEMEMAAGTSQSTRTGLERGTLLEERASRLGKSGDKRAWESDSGSEEEGDGNALSAPKRMRTNTGFVGPC